MTPDLSFIVDSFYHGMAHRNYPALRDMLDSNVEWNSAENFLYAENNPYVGIEKVTGILKQIEVDWETFTITRDETLFAGDTVIVRGRYRGKLRGTRFGLDAEFVHVLRFQNGKLVSGQSYTDTSQFRDAVSHRRQAAGAQTQTHA